ncbi:MAG: indole-3-glycerol phosphate synthase TrpC [bacterium]
MTILDKILAHKKEEVSGRKKILPLGEIKRLAESERNPRGFLKAVTGGGSRINVIAEVKKASPSKGVIRSDFHPESIALAYERSGACALSVLTDRRFFQGRGQYLSRIRAVVSLPLLMKDFVVDEYQIYEARTLGADAVLLIVAALEAGRLRQYLDLAREISLDVLLEIHNARELDLALQLGYPLIGINNRDLTSFKTDIKTTLDLLERIPADRMVVSESGIDSPETCRLLYSRGVKAVLVGEHLMGSPDIGQALRNLLSK